MFDVRRRWCRGAVVALLTLALVAAPRPVVADGLPDDFTELALAYQDSAGAGTAVLTNQGPDGASGGSNIAVAINQNDAAWQGSGVARRLDAGAYLLVFTTTGAAGDVNFYAGTLVQGVDSWNGQGRWQGVQDPTRADQWTMSAQFTPPPQPQPTEAPPAENPAPTETPAPAAPPAPPPPPAPPAVPTTAATPTPSAGPPLPPAPPPPPSSALPTPTVGGPPPPPPPPAGSASPRTVTRADNGTTVSLSVGDRFLLNLGLGTDYNASVRIADQTIVSRVPNVAVIQGAQGIYQANQVGQTTLAVTADPLCRAANPPCAIASITFQIQIVVNK